MYTVLICLLAVAVGLALGAYAVFSQPRFGALPQGDQLDLILKSPNFRNGEFKNLIPTSMFSKDVGMVSVLWSSIFEKNDRLRPERPIPTVGTDLKALSPRQDTVVWLGHSSWFVQLGGKRILIDPVLSDHAAPFSFLNKAFEGTGVYQAEDMPTIDCLLISHNHWDHLDYATVTALRPKVKQVICPLGLGAYFEQWGYPSENIHEGDWSDNTPVGDGLVVHILPARHYSGRLLEKNKTLWAGFALVTPARKIFFSGDSGYGPHFSKIGEAFQGFDLALLDCGQYDPRWAYIHMTPEEALQAARDLKAKALAPAHVGRFAIANHSWDEPFNRLTKAYREKPDKPDQLLTPKIGEPTALDDESSPLSRWWD